MNSEILAKIEGIESICVLYPRFQRIIDKLETCRVESQLAGESRSILIIGETGAGKTKLIGQYLAKFPTEYTDDGKIIPVFHASLPAKATIKGVAKTILEAMGAPRAFAGDIVDLTNRLVKLIKNCGVELLILDEFHHLLPTAGYKAAQGVSDWLKDLMNRTGIPIALVGLPECERLLEENEQLDRRFVAIEELAAFNYVTDQKEYRKFLKAVDGQLPFLSGESSVHIYDPLCALRIYVATQGRTGKTMTIIREAAKFAVKENSQYLTEMHLDRAYNEFLKRRSGLRKSPWEMDNRELELNAVQLQVKR